MLMLNEFHMVLCVVMDLHHPLEKMSLAQQKTELMETISNIFVKVANKLGKGYSENIYQEAVCVELRKLGETYSKEQVIPILYDQAAIGNVRADIVMNTKQIVIECKAIEGELKESNLVQLLNYMKLLGYNHGLYVNFLQSPRKPEVETYQVSKIDEHYEFIKLGANEKMIRLDMSGKLIPE